MSNVPLPAGTVLGKSFEWGLDINLGTYGSPVWQPFRRISGFTPSYPPTTADVTTYDDRGASNNEITGRGFACAFTAQANRNPSTGLYLPEIESIIAAGKAKGEGAVRDIRFYHKPDIGAAHPNEAGRAQVTVDVSRQNTGNSETEVYSVSLTGKGEHEPIVNPFTGWATTAPVLATVTPAGLGTGGLVIINGSGLLGATVVKFGTPNATSFQVISNAAIAAVLPSGSAGQVAITVTTPGGVSAPLNYTRAA